MTLKENLNEQLSEAFANEIEKLTDEFAIGFAEWLLIIYNEDIIYDAYSKEELLEIYKKENEL